MLTIADYENLYAFQNELLSIGTSERYYKMQSRTFITHTLAIMSGFFGYKDTAMAFLGNKSDRESILKADNIVYRKTVSSAFIQDFFMEYWNDNSFMSPTDANDDMLILSRTPNYTSLPVYSTVIKKHGYKDVLMIYIKNPDDSYYISFMVFFLKETVMNRDIELITKAAKSIAIGEESTTFLNFLQNQCFMQQSLVNNYPIGIMYVEKMNSVTYTNDIAKEYLAELGVTNEKFYSMFYIQELYKYFCSFQYDFNRKSTVRIKNYVFRLISFSNPWTYFTNENNNLSFMKSNRVSLLNNVTACIFIIKDVVREDEDYVKYSERTLSSFSLTSAERTVAEMIIAGLSNKEIAEKLQISINTVKIHVSNIFRKLDVNSRTKMISKLDAAERELS